MIMFRTSRRLHVTPPDIPQACARCLQRGGAGFGRARGSRTVDTHAPGDPREGYSSASACLTCNFLPCSRPNCITFPQPSKCDSNFPHSVAEACRIDVGKIYSRCRDSHDKLDWPMVAKSGRRMFTHARVVSARAPQLALGWWGSGLEGPIE